MPSPTPPGNAPAKLLYRRLRLSHPRAIVGDEGAQIAVIVSAQRRRRFPTQKKVADRRIDVRLYFETCNGLREMVLSVKGGTIRPTNVRDLRGVLERGDTPSLQALFRLGSRRRL